MRHFQPNLIRQLRRYSKRAALKGERLESQWETVIGLEIHAQISAKSKLFSGSGTTFASPINSMVSFFDASLPGTLPVLNRRCVEAGILTALALQCQLNLVSMFDRKHYFYADLPAGYQITQQRCPLAKGGHVEYLALDEDHKKLVLKRAQLTQLQLEQDSGKSLHDMEMSYSLIDLNRAGIGLMEIITEPEFCSAVEAASFVRELQLILQVIGVCDGKMEEGSLRVDASVSVRRPSEPLGVRSEIKNLNSIRHLMRSIEFETLRQISILESGGQVLNETRAYDVETGETVSMRDKERLHDYRFMAEPNLPPLRLYTNDTVPIGVPSDQIINVDDIRAMLPELPNAKRQRLKKQYGLSVEHSNVFVNEPTLLECFEKIVANQNLRNVKIASNICINEVLAAVNKKNIAFSASNLSAESVGELVDLVQDEVISLLTLRKILEVLLQDSSKLPKQVIEERGWHQVSNETALENICCQVIAANPKVVDDYKDGKTKVFNYLIGEVQKKLSGQSNVKAVVRIMKQKLDT